MRERSAATRSAMKARETPSRRLAVPREGDDLAALAKRLDALASRLDALEAKQTLLAKTQTESGEALWLRTDNIQARFYEANASSSSGGDGGDYPQLVRRVRECVRKTVPRDGTVAVISKGDDELLDLYGRTAWHFPREASGTYAGFHPPCSAAAIGHLEELRIAGASHLLIPATAAWWFDHYSAFGAHVARTYRLVFDVDDTAQIYALKECSPWYELGRLVTGIRTRLNRSPAILNWTPRTDLVRAFRDCAVFSPPSVDEVELPYLETSIDLVAVSVHDTDRLDEARRVATEAVVVLSDAERPPRIEPVAPNKSVAEEVGAGVREHRP